ncbi:hypothetical protein [Solibacillus sp. FSL H8-0538]|uniref:hypothetical protein n=1 Tax=Solibacillus sp. FSL H8-0538 TaxID=2921400 RepID=UPI0030FB542E
MRFLVTAAVLILIGIVIKFDLQQGTVPLTSFYQDTVPCVEQESYQSISVRVTEGDTIYSLFAATPSPIAMPFPERLARFYELNPHLQLQSLVAGELILLPIHARTSEICSK